MERERGKKRRVKNTPGTRVGQGGYDRQGGISASWVHQKWVKINVWKERKSKIMQY